MSESTRPATTGHNINESNVFASMPRDVLLNIMDEEVQETFGMINALSNEGPLWRLGQVCTHWRQTFRSNPIFWSRLFIHFGTVPHPIHPRALVNRFRQLVQLSGTTVTLCIGIWLAPSSTYELGDGVAGVLRDVVGRIDHLRITFTTYGQQLPVPDRARLPLPLLQSDLLKDCVFSSLHTLSIGLACSQVQLGDVELRVDTFARCPVLRHLTLWEETHRVVFVLPYQNLTYIKANGGRLDYILSHLGHLTDAHLELTPRCLPLTGEQPPEITFRSPPTWRAATLQTLNNLHFSGCSSFNFSTAERSNIFRSLHAPALRILRMEASHTQLAQIFEMIPDIALGGLQELIAFSASKTNVHFDDVQRFIRLMARMPSLRSLATAGVFGRYVLRALVEGDGLIPQLAVLTIDLGLVQDDCEKLVHLARGRRKRLSVEVDVSSDYGWGDKTKFNRYIRRSKVRIFWKELIGLAQVCILYE
ncbi:hypothetical protein CYLTODRAFT_494264 [Cylindrobasidium torrendii FP15055 ss-10]|uniref:Uncharacterized protein n=1 Tax=Cylindrobasidium torrendii FP15055 ss-10 TaxID=1314674 RepID=A0A0D7B0D6_9AGAR|nr:hypothetical protein CYLTODRAFT_494264 [Cylindrobasidium torrendii FP15055 ss-10]